MAGVEHRYVTKPRWLRGKKIVGGRLVGCTCGVAVTVADVRTGIRWHAKHRAELPDPRVVELAEITQRLAEIRARLDVLGAD